MSIPKRRQGALLEQAGPLTQDALALWALVDGRRQARELAQALGWSGPEGARRVWTALDLLADRGLLEARVAPPAGAMPFAGQSGLSRRQALRKLAAGIASGVAVAAAGRAAFAEPSKDSPAREKVIRQAEEHQKQVNIEEKAVNEATKKLKEAEACHAKADRVDEARKKQVDCPSLQRSRERHEKAVVRVRNARHREQQIKRHPLYRQRAQQEADQKR